LREPPPATAAGPVFDEIVRTLSAHPLFASLGLGAMAALAARSELARFEPGATLMTQGATDTCAYAILDGEADVFVELPAGPVRIATVGRHRIIGELAALTEMPRTATVTARTALLTVRIERDSLMAVAAEYPALALSIIGDLGSRMHGMNRSLAYLTYAADALGRGEYDPAMVAQLTSQPGELANFARVFAAMAEEIQAKEHRRQEMQAAAAIQQSILPGPLARDGLLRRVDLHAEMHPAREIGGDFYDYAFHEPHSLALSVADVSGKGIPAALFMAVSRTILRSAGGDDLAARMTAANRLLAAENDATMFVTLFHGVLDLATGVLRYCNAGHNPPYLLRVGGGVERLTRTGIAFGLDPNRRYAAGETTLAAGDALFLFSDGITEAFDPEGAEFGEARLEAALQAARGGAAAQFVAQVLAATAAFAAGAEQSDDITCLALVFAPEAPRPGA
jgi:serine phosphatase RsbU (regulator of sigma subunit)